LSDGQHDHVIRWAVVLAGLIGAAGIASAAAAAHSGAEVRLLGAASAICLANAPALLVLGLSGRRLRLGALCAALLALGTILFAGDVGLRAFLDRGLFPMAAPTGGSTMIIGWLLVGMSALFTRRGK
jgi:uncharacterized membrane protein YgdD (TMEM256/DUF423 family)